MEIFFIDDHWFIAGVLAKLITPGDNEPSGLFSPHSWGIEHCHLPRPSYFHRNKAKTRPPYVLLVYGLVYLRALRGVRARARLDRPANSRLF